MVLPARSIPPEFVYALGESVEVVDSTAEVRIPVATLRPGDRAEVLKRTQHWMKVSLGDGRTGWVEAKGVLDEPTYNAGKRLLESLNQSQSPAQAEGHASDRVNLRIGPSRDAPQIGQLDAREKVGIFARYLVGRPAQSGGESPASAEESVGSSAARREAWYLVRAGSKAGWVVGRLIDLDIPEGLSMYAQGTNLVAWIVLSEVVDNGREVPQYLVADRMGTPDVDFNHIRVLTWWTKRQHYVTAYVESNLNGYFPIRVGRVDGRSVFRLHLVDRDGNKFQRVYELFDTLTRPVGTVKGWQSQAMPQATAPERRRARRPHGAAGRRSPR